MSEDLIVGMMWAKDEADVITETLTDFASKVDLLYLAEDSSSDNTYDLMKSFQDKNKDKVFLQREYNKNDKAQRNSLLNKIRKRHDPKKTWVQICESDTVILDTDIREAISNYAVSDLAVSWQMLNAVNKDWSIDDYPNWKKSIREILPIAHFMEVLIYTFRPLSKLYFSNTLWRPYPSGFLSYSSDPVKRNRKFLGSPLLLHCGYRGPTHFQKKYAAMGQFHRKYKTWELTNSETVKRTVPFFNGKYASGSFPANREGWKQWVLARNPTIGT